MVRNMMGRVIGHFIRVLFAASNKHSAPAWLDIRHHLSSENRC